jgi:hypothetical protein
MEHFNIAGQWNALLRQLISCYPVIPDGVDLDNTHQQGSPIALASTVTSADISPETNFV